MILNIIKLIGDSIFSMDIIRTIGLVILFIGSAKVLCLIMDKMIDKSNRNIIKITVYVIMFTIVILFYLFLLSILMLL